MEYGEKFSKLCEKKFEGYKNFSVITDKFENVSFPDFQYDLVYSASAFHWVPEDIGYSKVYDMLKHGGAFARFANHPYRDKGNPVLLYFRPLIKTFHHHVVKIHKNETYLI